MSERRSRTLRMTFVILGVVLGIVFFLRLGPKAVGAQLSRVGPEVLWLAVPYTLGTAVGALPWALLLPKVARPGPLAVLAGRFAASGANALLPFFGLAGEPSRLMWLAATHRPRGAAAVIVDRVSYNVAGALLLLLGAVAAYFGTSLPPSLCLAAGAIGVALVVGTLGFLYVVSHFGMGRRLEAWLEKRFGSRNPHSEFGAGDDVSLRALLVSGARPTWLGLCLHFVGRVLLALEVYVALWVLDADATFVRALVLATVPIATGIVASTIPSQLGVQEAAQTLMCGALGMNPALGFTLVLLMRMRQLLFVPLTPILLGVAHAPVSAGPSGAPPAKAT